MTDRNGQQPQQHSTEYARLQRAAHQMLDAADTAARRGDTATEQRAEQAAGRLLDQAQTIR
ncbi:hypothetical protein ACSLFT_28535 [Streptomyces sp. G6]|uniref:hypothetical protein n=1 Tax=Streptomyces sp. G6 TaxID=1178736 RepID=UPI003EDACDE0